MLILGDFRCSYLKGTTHDYDFVANLTVTYFCPKCIPSIHESLWSILDTLIKNSQKTHGLFIRYLKTTC